MTLGSNHSPDLTTAPQRATCSVPEDAKAIAPADPSRLDTHYQSRPRGPDHRNPQR